MKIVEYPQNPESTRFGIEVIYKVFHSRILKMVHNDKFIQILRESFDGSINKDAEGLRLGFTSPTSQYSILKEKEDSINKAINALIKEVRRVSYLLALSEIEAEDN